MMREEPPEPPITNQGSPSKDTSSIRSSVSQRESEAKKVGWAKWPLTGGFPLIFSFALHMIISFFLLAKVIAMNDENLQYYAVILVLNITSVFWTFKEISRRDEINKGLQFELDQLSKASIEQEKVLLMYNKILNDTVKEIDRRDKKILKMQYEIDQLKLKNETKKEKTESNVDTRIVSPVNLESGINSDLIFLLPCFALPMRIIVNHLNLKDFMRFTSTCRGLHALRADRSLSIPCELNLNVHNRCSSCDSGNPTDQAQVTYNFGTRSKMKNMTLKLSKYLASNIKITVNEMEINVQCNEPNGIDMSRVMEIFGNLKIEKIMILETYSYNTAVNFFCHLTKMAEVDLRMEYRMGYRMRRGNHETDYNEFLETSTVSDLRLTGHSFNMDVVDRVIRRWIAGVKYINRLVIRPGFEKEEFEQEMWTIIRTSPVTCVGAHGIRRSDGAVLEIDYDDENDEISMIVL